jgi:hypothetical protein
VFLPLGLLLPLAPTGRFAEREWPNYPAGMDIPQFYTNDLEMLLADLYPNGLPDDHRLLRIMLARKGAKGADDGLMTPDARFDFLEALNEILPGIRERRCWRRRRRNRRR